MKQSVLLGCTLTCGLVFLSLYSLMFEFSIHTVRGRDVEGGRHLLEANPIVGASKKGLSHPVVKEGFVNITKHWRDFKAGCAEVRFPPWIDSLFQVLGDNTSTIAVSSLKPPTPSSSFVFSGDTFFVSFLKVRSDWLDFCLSTSNTPIKRHCWPSSKQGGTNKTISTRTILSCT
eukprot:TRINITY_DN25213_c0_g1_i1.p1 TRINITY_DN25213_c0_g1~~TRINITY_DN25213_c0_g1_i1.p1  ORF type:complete len:174 (+),score=12.77 TRINITY_DN25213_c0_g1_i1:67-588(+)